MIKMLIIASLMTGVIVLEKSKNPLKASTTLLGLSSMMFLSLKMESGMTWFPLILFMLFTGGILLTFMILSSIMPNEKADKIKASAKSLFVIFLSACIITSMNSPSGKENLGEVKSMITSPFLFLFLSTLMLLYFFYSIGLQEAEETPMRSLQCCSSSNFVNCKSEAAMKTLKIFRKEDKIMNTMNNSLWDLPSPSTMSYFWNFGSTLGICLMVQILTGILLTLHYTSYAEESFSSVVKIMREIWSGWLIRFVHMNGASMFFFFIYLHLFRGLYYKSSTHGKVWMSGVTIMIILMGVSFLGYVLPWGQMSYWAVAVITNLLSVVPMVGDEVVKWIWGGFSVSNPTLTRFYSFHFLFPFILLFLTLMHLVFLHEQGSSNSMGLNSNMDKISFHPYFTVKDTLFIFGVISISMMISFFTPYILGDAINNVPANAMQTPVHIQPEWYFLPSYAILRSLPSKTAGVLALLLSVTIFYLIPVFKLKFSTKFNKTRQIIFWSAVASFMFLMKMGALPAEEPYVTMSQYGAMMYFSTIMLLNL